MARSTSVVLISNLKKWDLWFYITISRLILFTPSFNYLIGFHCISETKCFGHASDPFSTLNNQMAHDQSANINFSVDTNA